MKIQRYLSLLAVLTVLLAPTVVQAQEEDQSVSLTGEYVAALKEDGTGYLYGLKDDDNKLAEYKHGDKVTVTGKSKDVGAYNELTLDSVKKAE